jgi:hypothetical protein
MNAFWILVISVTFTTYILLLVLLYWEGVRPTRASRSYLSWFKRDQAERKATEDEWRDGNWS